MKQTLNNFSHKALAFTILTASLSLPAFANTADVAAGVNASANINADAVTSAATQSAKHAKHQLVKKTKAVKQQASETVSNGAEKVKSSTETGVEAVKHGTASVSTQAKAMVAPAVAAVEPAAIASAPAADANASSSTNVGIQTPVGSIGGGVHVGAGIR